MTNDNIFLLIIAVLIGLTVGVLLKIKSIVKDMIVLYRKVINLQVRVNDVENAVAKLSKDK